MKQEKEASADSAIEKLNHLLEDNKIFTDEEAVTLKEVAEAWKAAKGFVKITKYMGGTLKWCVGFGVTYAAFKAGLFEFLTPKGE